MAVYGYGGSSGGRRGSLVCWNFIARSERNPGFRLGLYLSPPQPPFRSGAQNNFKQLAPTSFDETPNFINYSPFVRAIGIIHEQILCL
jgi:hypothetical protein